MYLYWAWNILLKWWFNLVQMKTLCFMRSLSPCVPKFNSMENVKYYFLETSFGNNTVNGIYDHCGMQIQTCTNEGPSFRFTYQLWLPLRKCPKKAFFFNPFHIWPLDVHSLPPWFPRILPLLSFIEEIIKQWYQHWFCFKEIKGVFSLLNQKPTF